MRHWLRASSIAVAGALLAGCAGQRTGAPEAALMQRFQSGEASLACTSLPCQFAWVGQRPNALQLYNSERWNELAGLVLRTGYRNDLTYYYLGRAAEGLNFLPAAQNYYRTSEQLTDSSLGCARGNNSCDGFVFPEAAETRLRSVEAALAPPPEPAKRVVHRRTTKKPTASASQKTPASSTEGVYLPPASAASSSSGGAPSSSAPASQSSSGGVYMPPPQH
jgi:hypothetical protein